MAETSRHGMNQSRQSPSMGLITRQKEPKNLETPFGQVDSFLTPIELFYIRSHFPPPSLDVASYRLRIDGAVPEPALFELRGAAPDALGDEGRHARMRGEQPGLSRTPGQWGPVGAWCRRQRRVDRRSPGRLARARRPGGRRLRDRARRSRPGNTQRSRPYRPIQSPTPAVFSATRRWHARCSLPTG